MYRNMHGENVQAPYLKKILGLVILDKTVNYRYRDIFLKEKGTKILLLTRMGGGNREGFESQINSLKEHPYYIKDYDDNYDCTYAYFEFSVPDEYLADCKKFYVKETKSLKERSEQVMEEMAKMSKEEAENDPRFKPLFDIVKQIAKVSKGEQEPPENNIFTI